MVKKKMIPVIYGIPNCDTMKKTFTWFDAHQIPYQFHNYKTEGLSEALLAEWLAMDSDELLINRKGTTFRTLSATEQKNLNAPKRRIAVILNHLSVIKRPVIAYQERIWIGYQEHEWKKIFLS